MPKHDGFFIFQLKHLKYERKLLIYFTISLNAQKTIGVLSNNENHLTDLFYLLPVPKLI